MDKNKIFKKHFFKKKRVWLAMAVIIVALGVVFLRSGNNAESIVTDTVELSPTLAQTVLATGQVTSQTDLDLSFNTSGVVKRLYVAVGNSVKEGTILATLDQGSSFASLTQARGALDAANARLKRTLEGASTEEVTLTRIALDNAKRDYENSKLSQENLVSNAYNAMLNSTLEATTENGTNDTTLPTISGTYNLGKEGRITISMYTSGNGEYFNISGLFSGNGVVSNTVAQPIGNSGLYIKFPSGSSTKTWVIDIPNKRAANYLVNSNAYQTALRTRESALLTAQSLIDQRTAELTLKQASARDSDIDLARADIVAAQGQVQAAEARYNDTIIRAPASGTVTRIDIKLGELAQAQKPVIVLQDISNIYIEANINEANISNITVGLPIEVTYDAFGPDKIFKGSIRDIDPASTLISGVVNYKVTASVEQTAGLRPGMTANMIIKIKEKANVLTVPSRAIITDSDTGKKIVRLITNPKSKAYKEIEVTTGMEGDGGLVEVTSGLKQGDEFVVLIKK
jgi:HlyD family secretion protein